MSSSGIRSRSLVAPIVSAAVLVAVAAWGLGIARVKADPAYLANVAAAIDAIPYSIDGMMGTDVTPTPAAVKLLNPNRILQRQYTEPGTGRISTLMVVHCSDVRDILGHYPPVCYPAHGWVAESTTPTTIEWNGATYPAKLYRFSRSGNDMSMQEMTVLSFFVLPSNNSPIVADMDHLEDVARRPAVAGRGAAQFQILWTDRRNPGENDSATKAMLRAASPVIRCVLEGDEHE
ncbi:MAG: exosortase-associated EpsI family protein [Phycisphaerales bacterium]